MKSVQNVAKTGFIVVEFGLLPKCYHVFGLSDKDFRRFLFFTISKCRE